MKAFICRLKGTFYHGAITGSDRLQGNEESLSSVEPTNERLVRLLLPNERLELRREPRNEHDKNAIAVFWTVPRDLALRLRIKSHPYKLGYVERNAAKLLATEVLKDAKIFHSDASEPYLEILVTGKRRRITKPTKRKAKRRSRR